MRTKTKFYLQLYCGLIWQAPQAHALNVYFSACAVIIFWEIVETLSSDICVEEVCHEGHVFQDILPQEILCLPLPFI